MLTPYEDNYGAFQVISGEVVCAGVTPTWPAYLWAPLLIFLHFFLVLFPAFAAQEIYFRSDLLEWRGVKSVGWMLASMGIFGIAGFAEIGRHFIDNWLYLGLIPSWSLTFFYGGLTLAQAMLAKGAQQTENSCCPDKSSSAWAPWSILNFGCAGTVVTVLSVATVQQHANQGPVMNLEPLVVWIIVFTCLAIPSAAVFLTSRLDNWEFWALLTAGCQAAGIIFSIFVTSFGLQVFHLPTVMSFLLSFVCESYYIIMSGSRLGCRQLEVD